MVTTVVLPDGMAIDGAVVELGQHPDGTISADLRIPAPKPAMIPYLAGTGVITADPGLRIPAPSPERP